jgi:hypothetical protein
MEESLPPSVMDDLGDQAADGDEVTNPDTKGYGHVNVSRVR